MRRRRLLVRRRSVCCDRGLIVCECLEVVVAGFDFELSSGKGGLFSDLESEEVADALFKLVVLGTLNSLFEFAN
jgi:hypothetical protein|tara:strand:+ start:324 stop:545 length:222 start_codon:yes stop_codon:yes gene_type:complete